MAEGKYVWSQDRAPCHTAKKEHQLCKANFADFWRADFWPFSSPDLKPLDYAVFVIDAPATEKVEPQVFTRLKHFIVSIVVLLFLGNHDKLYNDNK